MVETGCTKQWSMDSLLASFFAWLACLDLSLLARQQGTNCYHSERHQQQLIWRLHQQTMARVTFTYLLPNVAVDCEQCWRNEREHVPSTNVKHGSISLLVSALFLRSYYLYLRRLLGLHQCKELIFRIDIYHCCRASKDSLV